MLKDNLSLLPKVFMAFWNIFICSVAYVGHFKSVMISYRFPRGIGLQESHGRLCKD